MRREYETPADLKNEEAIIDVVQDWMQSKGFIRTFRKMPKMSTVDYATCNGDEITSWVEVRKQSFPSNKYDAVMIDYRKVVKMLEWASWSQIPLLFVVGYSDDEVIAWRVGHKWNKHLLGLRWLHRNAPRDAQDNAPVAMIKKDAFEIVREGFRLQ